MDHACWNVDSELGFLLHPQPLAQISDALAQDQPVALEDIRAVEQLAANLSHLIETGQVRREIDALPIIDYGGIRGTSDLCTSLIIERLQQIYTYLANAYVYATGEEQSRVIPASVAVPLTQLSGWVERPPIMAYCNYTLGNWQKIDPAGEIVVENLRMKQLFLDLPDEAWFARVHVEVEAKAGVAVRGLLDAIDAADRIDLNELVDGLDMLHSGLHSMILAFNKMSKGCDPDVYYRRIRPYLFGLNDIVYEGVDAFGGQPQSFRGASGAQSAVVPALVAGLGVLHERSSLMQHLDVMRAYMPVPHRKFIDKLNKSELRDFIKARGHGSAVAEVYNECLRELMGFRKLHLHYASVFIFQRSQEPPLGTGGTDYMRWLPLLIDETERHLI
jgi:indoleamine 2,3-dioxygenase